jgi:hypothetical protein
LRSTVGDHLREITARRFQVELQAEHMAPDRKGLMFASGLRASGSAPGGRSNVSPCQWNTVVFDDD